MNKQITVKEIKTNPLNVEIYLQNSVDDLVESIKNVGLLEPLIIDQNNLLISGHRRLKALTELNIETADVIVKEYESDLDRQQDFLDSTRQREKTTLDRMNEMELEKKIIGKRQGQRTELSQNPDEVKGRTDDILAKKYNLGSRDSLRKLEEIREELGDEAIIELDDDKKNSSIHKTYNRIKKEKRIQEENKEIERLKENPHEIPLDLRLGDFRTTDIEPNSVDLILTDPPYPEEFLPLWKDLGVFAKKALKPGGFLVAYSGQFFLPQVIKHLDESLSYFWIISLYHAMDKGGTSVYNARNIQNGWKPVLVYQKPPTTKPRFYFYDVVTSEKSEKDSHEWQQSESGAEKLIEIFSKPGELVVDPFAGGGTFPLVAHQMQRKAIGIEIDEGSYLKANKRIFEATK